MQPGQHLGHAFEIAAQTPEACQPGKAALDDLAPGQQHKALFRLKQLDHLQLDAVCRRIAFGLLARVPGIGPGQFDRISRGLLHLLAQRIDLGSFLLIGRRYRQRNQVAQRIDRCMHFGATAPLVAVVSCAGTAFATALQCSAVQDDSAGLALAALGGANDGAHVADHRLKAARLIPAPELLIHHWPRRQIIGQHAPGGAGPGQPTQCVEHFAQAVAPLGRVLVNQGQVGRHKAPFVVAHIAGIRLSRHPQHIGTTQEISAVSS